MFVQIALGLEGKSAGFTGVGSLVGVGSNVFVQDAGLGADHLTKGTDISFSSLRVVVMWRRYCPEKYIFNFSLTRVAMQDFVRQFINFEIQKGTFWNGSSCHSSAEGYIQSKGRR